MTLKRYDIDRDGDVMEMDDGLWVKYEDVAAEINRLRRIIARASDVIDRRDAGAGSMYGDLGDVLAEEAAKDDL